MVTLKLAALLTIAAVVAFASSAVVTSTYDVTRENDVDEDQNPITTPDFTEDEDEDSIGDDDSEAVIDGISLKYLTEKELNEFLDEEDNNLANDLDICAARKIVRARKDRGGVVTGHRQKRWIAVAARLFAGGRALFRGAIRAPKQTVVGNRVTQQYTRPGNYNDANRQFNSFRPDNVNSFTSRGGISGRTGTVGNHRVTVRDGSKQGSPTLEIRSPKPDGTYVRKFRFEN